jgi:hypothetical protein
MENKLIGIREAAALLGVHENFVRTRCSEKYLGLHIKHVKLAGRLKFWEQDVRDYANFFVSEAKDTSTEAK